MKLEFDISNNPRHTGVKRKIVLDENCVNYTLDFSEMVMKIHYYDEVDGDYGDCLDSVKGFEPTPYNLTAGTIKVDPVTGDSVERILYDAEDNVVTDPSIAVRVEWPTYILEWEFFKNIKPSDIGLTEDNSMIEILTGMYAFVIQRRDAFGGFNS